MADDFITGEEVGKKLLAAAQEMAAGKGVVVHSPTLSVRQSVGLSQSCFAALLGVSVRTLQDWEQGRRSPSGAALTLLRVAERHPGALRELSGTNAPS